MQFPKCLRGLLPALLILLAACSSSTTSTDGGETAAGPGVSAGDSGEAPEGAAPTTGEGGIPATIDVAAYRDTARTAMFVPAPSEFQAALKATEASSVDIRGMVVDSDRDIADKSKPIIALETGVRLANVLLTAQTGDKAVVVQRMKSAREGLAAIGASDAVMAEIDKVMSDFESDTLGAGELSPALDVLAERIQDQLNDSADPTMATLVQAGGWLQGAHLLSSALAQAKVGGDAAALLRQPTVLAYFSEFLAKAGSGDPKVEQVLEDMKQLQEVAKKDSLGVEDMNTIAAMTGSILKSF